MVHALEEIHRVLVAGGFLIDLRPITEEWPIEVITVRETRRVGNVTALPEDLLDDEVANRSLNVSEERGLFQRDTQSVFAYDYFWDSPSEMKDYVETEWDDWVTISKNGWTNIRSAWALADGDARLRIPVKMLIARWKRPG